MTSKQPERSSDITGVGCDVCNCKYNDRQGGYCTALHINVQNRSASTKGETFCDTFAPRGSSGCCG
ncbi:MAG: DUF1540 domain-containing protein [Oscillospiraceae bacterium]|nr:DUF1540 domain-containing protein [Oscillospiraceae bacterium]MCC8155948.1 DUF1540 domain-containing protein [Oscillospiraceae bacterium]MCD7767970.1 DUF1540 domain-containing protein [Oscillospiraceae bacterium]MCD7852517.1 DUF1540 domain-containing protein [Oscillospiraceae bacterium]MCD7860549.1 DUF1540 domain-containing protein [Oscillospiraceae bacterium]